MVAEEENDQRHRGLKRGGWEGGRERGRERGCAQGWGKENLKTEQTTDTVAFSGILC